jgi:hypothetical protein
VLKRAGSAAAWTVAPNRIFNIEWRAVYFSANTSGANFEVRSYEATGAINFIYGEVANAGSAPVSESSAIPGVPSRSFECNAGGTSRTV